jgi:uncharacterized protein
MTAHDPLQAPESQGDLVPDLAPDSAPDLAPVAAHERIQALDVVRGFALVGIFLMNMEFFARPMQDIVQPGVDPTLVGADRIADFLVFFFVQSKFWTLFSLLFGMGFAVMIERARRAGRPFVPAYLRRSLALLGIGAVHALLVWSGDILVTYAIGALVLLSLRGAYRGIAAAIAGEPMEPAKPALLAGLGIALYAIPLVLMLAWGISGSASSAMGEASPEQQRAQERAVQAAADEREAAVYAYRDGSYADAVRQRVIDTAHSLEPGNLVFFLFLLLGTYFIGMAILRAGIVADPRSHDRALRRMRNVGLPVGFALMALSTALGTGMNFHEFGLRDSLQVTSYLAAGLVLALAYAATLVLALDGPCGGWLQRWLAPAGRMALTNYLAQSVFGSLLFYGYGLGQWGHLGRAQGVALALGFYALQLVASRLWLAQFRFGPAEWVWRALTYLHLPPMRRGVAAA